VEKIKILEDVEIFVECNHAGLNELSRVITIVHWWCERRAIPRMAAGGGMRLWDLGLGSVWVLNSERINCVIRF
jgi:hypothetical protein